jgi:hypothetical protein
MLTGAGKTSIAGYFDKHVKWEGSDASPRAA